MTDYDESPKEFESIIAELKGYSDSRSPELIEAHELLARENLKLMELRAEEFSSKRTEFEALPPPQAGSPYKYKTDVATTGVLFGVAVAMEFYSDNYKTRIAQFIGGGGGIGSYTSISRGTSFLNYPIETLLDWKARFEMNFVPLTVNVNLWGMHKERIGSFIGGGLSSAGVFGGKGKFHRP
ncbi:MAG: hypothetical protein HZB28_10965 [Methylocystis sp.]|nr:hypothetical protein [Methylocystis sp.]